jgi:hypothetical protein
MERLFLKFELQFSYQCENNFQIQEIIIDLAETNSFIDFLSIVSKNLQYRISMKRHCLQVFYENLWVHLIDLPSLYFFLGNNLKLGISNKIRILNKSYTNEVGFTIEGEKLENQMSCSSNRPNMKIYDHRSLPEIHCSLCGISSKDELMIMKIGPFYGPFKEGSNRYFIHELCAIWSPNVFLDKYGKLRSICKEVKRAKKLNCSYCGNKGAGLGCSKKNCRNTYHFLCAKSVKSHFNDQDYLIFCPDHLDNVPLSELEALKSINLNRDSETPYSLMVCQECKSGLDEDKLLICDSCDHGIHSYCNIPEIPVIPKDDELFNCHFCLSSYNIPLI